MTDYETTNTTRLPLPELGACALVQDLLPLYLEGEVSPGSRDLIVEHLARCEKCAGFLAGAQSVRAQVRRDATQRASVAVREQPALQTIAQGNWLLTAFAVLTGSVFGAGGSFMLLAGLANWSLSWLLLGVVTVAASFVFLTALAHSRSPLTWQRMLALIASCAMGAASPIPLFVLDGEMASAALCVVIGLVGLAGVWASVTTTAGAPQPGSAPATLSGKHVALVMALLIGGGLALLLPLLFGQALPIAGVLGVIVLLALLVGPARA